MGGVSFFGECVVIGATVARAGEGESGGVGFDGGRVGK